MTTKITVLPSENNPFWQYREVLFILRFVWFTLVIFTLLMMGIGLPRAFLGAMQTYGNPLNWRGAAAIAMGLPVQALAWYYFSVDAIMMVVATTVALLLFWRGSRDGSRKLIRSSTSIRRGFAARPGRHVFPSSGSRRSGKNFSRWDFRLSFRRNIYACLRIQPRKYFFHR